MSHVITLVGCDTRHEKRLHLRPHFRYDVSTPWFFGRMFVFFLSSDLACKLTSHAQIIDNNLSISNTFVFKKEKSYTNNQGINSFFNF